LALIRKWSVLAEPVNAQGIRWIDGFCLLPEMGDPNKRFTVFGLVARCEKFWASDAC
jgi:hypothetical protein